jgi:hypothetical protein
MSLFWWSLSGYLAFFKKKVVAASLGGGLALVDVEDLANNISNSFYSFL